MSPLIALSVVAASVAPSVSASPADTARLSFEPRDLGDLGIATAINDRGVVVGVKQFELGFDRATGADAALRLPGAEETDGVDVSDSGLVLGRAWLPTGLHTVIWAPRR